MIPHWTEQLARRAIEEKTEPYVISAGITTSGPAHLGTLCEFLFPGTIRKEIIKLSGKQCKFYFFADIYDAFDSVPVSMQQYEAQLNPYLGKPLCDVPDPTGKTKSFGDYFLDEVRGLMKKFGIEAEIVRINEWYADGRIDKYIKYFLENEAQAREIMERTSGKQQSKDWSAIMPVCANCGKIATTRVLSHDGENYEYICDRDVKYTKGCGYKGKNSIYDHKCKLVWRMHWPMWHDLAGTTLEGAGVDHFTKGGSHDTLEAVFKEMFKKPVPIGYKYGFILFEGKKYSKSKGIGMGVSDMITLLPVELIKYILLKPDLQENIDINPTSENLLKAIEDFQGAAVIAADGKNPDELPRQDQKRLQAYLISTDKRNWKAQFLDVLLYYQVYGDWNEVGRMTGDPSGVEYLKPFVLEWIAREFIPEDYRFKYQPKKADGSVRGMFESLDAKLDALGIHNAVFEYAKANGVEPKEMFKMIYSTLIGKEKGPRIGKLVFALGVERVKKDVL
ncbi:MAG: lysine--tRNA ligase [Candidatus Micrarchaeia archaeon]